MNKGNIPVLNVEGATIPHAWENAVKAVWEKGIDIKTEYDKPEDPPSKDATVIITVEDPFAEPRIHRYLPCGLDFIEIYINEVVNGVHDHYINPAEGKWEYTYAERIFEYSVPTKSNINQIDEIVNILKNCSHSRRAQFVTWKVWEDLGIEVKDPACLQRGLFRIINNKLNANFHMRSNDGLKAALLNMIAFTELQKIMKSEKKYDIIENRYYKKGKG